MGSPKPFPVRAGRDSKRDCGEDKARLRQAGMGGSWFASVLYAVTPNWQLFWFGDTLESEKTEFNWNYVARPLLYVVGYVGATLAIACSFVLGEGTC